jgi:hypothetical protein
MKFDIQIFFCKNIYVKFCFGYERVILTELWLLDLIMIIYYFTSRSRIFHLYGDVTITGEGLQNLGLCSALRAFEQGGIFIVPHLLWHGASVFPVLSEGPPHLIVSCDSQGDAEDLFLPGYTRVPIQWPLMTRKGVLRTYSYPGPHGVLGL